MIDKITTLIQFIVFLELIACCEAYLDRKTASAVDADGIRTTEENKVLHGYQMPWRICSVLIAAFPEFNAISIHNIIEFIVLCIMSLPLYWFLFDATVNLYWLKKGIFFQGKTSKTDVKFGGKKSIVIKIIGSLTLIITYFII